MPDLRSERFDKLVLGVKCLILGLIQGLRHDNGLGRPDLRSGKPYCRFGWPDWGSKRPDFGPVKA